MTWSTGRPSQEVRDALSLLTRRERDVLSLVAEGRSNAQIAGTLHLSEATIKGHVSRLRSIALTRSRRGMLTDDHTDDH